jgi:hypothetical protein
MAVQTITYGDKQYLNENANIPATNKVEDTDMNEIKSVVNNNATELTNIIGKILWTNPNPNSAISTTQEITLSSSDYDVLEVFYIQVTNGNLCYSSRFLKGNSTRMRIHTTDGTNVYRGITYLSDISYRIDLPYSETTIANINSLAIPLYIVGYKTGLFS